jgi:hypothetical protein
MATGNHYLLDAIAGGVTMGVGALLAAALTSRPDLSARIGGERLDDVIAGRSTAPLRAAAAATSATRNRAAEERATTGTRGAEPELCSPRS